MTEKNSVTVKSGTEVPALTGEEGFVAPLADIYETQDAYMLLLDMPGASREGLSVRLERGVLSVKAPVGTLLSAGASVVHREQTASGFERAFMLGEDIDPEHIDAQFENGVLTVKLFKSEHAKPREISIR
jgi:HSP20 family protein